MSSALIISIFITLLIFIITAFLFCLRFHYKRKKGASVMLTNAPGSFPSAVGTASGGYPVTVVSVTPGSYQATVHSTPPYPTQPPLTAHVAMPMPMPMPVNQPPLPGFQAMPPYPQMAPYSPNVNVNTTATGIGQGNLNPPSYDMAVGHPSESSLYEKQAPYNPHFVSN